MGNSSKAKLSLLTALFTLGLLLPVTAQDMATCTVRSRQNVNRRMGPGTGFGVVGVLLGGQNTAINGQATGDDGLVWWQLADGSWVRSDTVDERGNCENLPVVSLSLLETPFTPTASPTTATLEATEEADSSALYHTGDEVVVYGQNMVFLIYSEPSTSASVAEATISGVSLVIVGGPQIVDGETWWQVRSPSGLEGWVLETIDGQTALLLPGTSSPPAELGLRVGEEAIVAGQGKVLLIYAEPRTDASVVEATVSGVTLTITDGPEVVEGVVWWQVRSPSGTEGWTPETIDGEPAILSPRAVLAINTPTPVPTAVVLVTVSATVDTARLNVRRGPGPEYDEVRQLSRGQAITIIGRNDDGSWVQLDSADQQWVNAQYVIINGNVSTLPVTFTEVGDWGPPGEPTGAKARATTTLRLRGGPGTNYRQLENPDILKPGSVVDIVGQSVDGIWYQVNVNNRSAWIRAEGVTLTGSTNASIPVTSP
ncbi:MAG: SH3 domain-containing protein [Chloroflexi bacterium]|nr:SH3 domain-containing protein [Chloroflexota bacterium]